MFLLLRAASALLDPHSGFRVHSWELLGWSPGSDHRVPTAGELGSRAGGRSPERSLGDAGERPRGLLPETGSARSPTGLPTYGIL